MSRSPGSCSRWWLPPGDILIGPGSSDSTESKRGETRAGTRAGTYVRLPYSSRDLREDRATIESGGVGAGKRRQVENDNSAQFDSGG